MTVTAALTAAPIDVTKPEGTELYKAGCEALVSEASSESTFSKMINCAFGHSTVGNFEKEVQETEAQIKSDFSITSMPGPWRSSKSVIISAMKLGIKLIDDNGSFLGKTNLQNQIKNKRIELKEEYTNDTYAKRVIMMLINIPKYLDAKKVFDQVRAFTEE